jgi:predicted regulator of amino acid metabolism with ACT domain
MWDLLTRYFQRYPAQTKVAQTLLRYGLSVEEDGVYCAEIGIPDTGLARACDVDRRIISATVETIHEHDELRNVYRNLEPTVHLADVAPELDWGVLEIVPTDAHEPGILAEVATIIADREVSIRQAVVDDPDLVEEPTLYVVTEEEVPMDVIPEIRDAEGVRSVTIR